MPIADPEVDEEKPVPQNYAREPTAFGSKSAEQTDSGPLQVARVRRLDVDAVLARSLAKVVSE